MITPTFSSSNPHHPAKACLIFCGASLLLAFVFLIRARWPATPSYSFVNFEQGQTLHYTDLVLAGAKIYGDFFCQYGPIPLLAYSWFASVCGNSAETYVIFSHATNAIAFILAGLLLRRWLSDSVALIWAGLAVAGRILRPPAHNPYPAFEIAFLLAAMLCWQTPSTRRYGRSFGIGICLGLMQTAKFGGAFPSGLVLLLADALQLFSENRPVDWWRWCRNLIAIAGGFLLVEGILAAWLFHTLPHVWALDVLWPAYMRGTYSSYAHPDIAFSTWRGVSFFATSQLPALLGCLVTVILLLRCVRRAMSRKTTEIPSLASRSTDDFLGLAAGLSLLFPAYLAVGYLPHFWLGLAYLWLPALAVGASLPYQARRSSFSMVILFLGSIVSATINPMVRGAAPSDNAAKPTEFPNGERLYVTAEEKRVYDTVLASIKEHSREGTRPVRCLFFEASFGWAHYSGGSVVSGVPSFRHHWFMSGFVRRDEEEALITALTQVDVVMVDLSVAGPSANINRPATWGRSNPGLSEHTLLEFFARCEKPRLVAPNIWQLKPLHCDAPRP